MAGGTSGPRSGSLRSRWCARIAAPLAVVALAGVALTACVPAARPEPRDPMTPTPARTATKTGTGEVRHDLDPLASRIPALADVVKATWLSGTLGDPAAPGPSLYWIDAVVTLPAGVADGLRDSLELAAAEAAPDVVETLGPSVPAGGMLAGPALDDAYSAAGWRSTAYLEEDGDRLVLAVVGE